MTTITYHFADGSRQILHNAIAEGVGAMVETFIDDRPGTFSILGENAVSTHDMGDLVRVEIARTEVEL